jgi:hypothetical protein
MAQYRLGNYQEAADWAQSPAQGPFLPAQAEACAILSMARYKQGNDEEARLALANCNRIIETTVSGAGQDLGQDWRDWIVVLALQSEAKQMMDGQSVSAAPSTSPAR